MIAVITGASAGVGRATARLFAQAGWDLALIARGAAGLEAAADEARAAGRRALVLPLDVADAAAVEAAAERIEHELGPIDAWINVAMESVFAPVDETADHGAHGRFDDRASATSPLLEISLHRRLVAGLVAAAAAALVGVRWWGTGSADA